MINNAFFMIFSYRVKVEVDDGCDVAVFVVFDYDCQRIFEKTCKEFVYGTKVSILFGYL